MRCLRRLFWTDLYLQAGAGRRVDGVPLTACVYLRKCMGASLPKATWVEGTRFARLSSVFRVINPGPFSLKEVRRFRVEVPGVANAEVA